MLHNVAHLRKPVLKLVSHEKPRETSPYGKDSHFPWLISKVTAELERVLDSYAICRCCRSGGDSFSPWDSNAIPVHFWQLWSRYAWLMDSGRTHGEGRKGYVLIE